MSLKPSLESGSGYLLWSLEASPECMTIDSSTGEIAWTEPVSSDEAYTVTVVVANSVGSTSFDYTITVMTMPVIAEIPDVVISDVESYTFTPSLVNGTGDISWSLESSPEGMAIDPNTGEITWGEPASSGASYLITVVATNSVGSSSESYGITVMTPPFIAGISDVVISDAFSYTFTPSLTSGTGDLVWSLELSPDGMTIDSITGEITWSEPASSNDAYEVTVSVSNSVGSSYISYSITVMTPPVISDISDAIISDTFSYTFVPTLASGTGDISWSLESSPEGVVIDSDTGEVVWSSPEASSTAYSVCMSANNSVGNSTKCYSLMVLTPLMVSSVPGSQITIYESYSLVPELVSGSGSLVWSLISAPEGMAIDETTGVIAWLEPVRSETPYHVCLEVSNEIESIQVCWHLTVTDPPVIGEIDDIEIPEYETYSFTPTLSSGIDSITWSLVSSPEGMVIDSETGEITWSSPQVSLSQSVTVRAENTDGYGEQSWDITVLVPPSLAQVADQVTYTGDSVTYYGPTPEVVTGSTPYTWTLLEGPEGMTVSSNTGRVIWSDPVYSEEPYSITLEVSNSVGSDIVAWNLTVLESLVIDEIAAQEVKECTPYAGPLPVISSGGPAVEWQLVSGPSGMTIDPDLGVVSWDNPVAIGYPYTITIKAVNAYGTEGQVSWQVTVPVSYKAVVYTDVEQTANVDSIPLYGQAIDLDTLEAVPDVSVKVKVNVKGVNRYLTATTDENGDFTANFNLLNNEAGHYYISAAHPAGESGKDTDEFIVYGMRVSPGTSSLEMLPDSSEEGGILITNNTDEELTQLYYEIVSIPDNISFDMTLPEIIDASDETDVIYTVTAVGGDINDYIEVNIFSQEGAAVTAKISLNVKTDKAVLSVDPTSLSASMLRGSQTMVTFDITNTGGGDSGVVNVEIPEADWLKLSTPAMVTSLAVGESSQVVLQLLPDEDLTLGDYTGTLLVSTSDDYVEVPFTFRAVSSAVGSIEVTSADEYTYYSDGNPKLQNADVVITDAISGVVVASGSTESAGQLTFSDIPESYYKVSVTAENHDSYSATIYVSPDQTKDVFAYLPYQTVKYTWSVVPVDLEDHYDINIETTFTTDVPAPAITIEPPVLDMSGLLEDGQSMQIDVDFTNHGLVDATDFNLIIGNHPEITITPLVNDVEVIPAGQTVTIPLIIVRQSEDNVETKSNYIKEISATVGNDDCTLSIHSNYSWDCYGANTKSMDLYTRLPEDYVCTLSSSLPVHTDSSFGGGSGYVSSYTGSDGSASWGYIPVHVSSPVACLGCEQSRNLSVTYHLI